MIDLIFHCSLYCLIQEVYALRTDVPYIFDNCYDLTFTQCARHIILQPPSLQTWTTIFLCTNPPSLPMMLSKSSKLIRPSESLSAYWKVLLTRIKDVGIAMQCLHHPNQNFPLPFLLHFNFQLLTALFQFISASLLESRKVNCESCLQSCSIDIRPTVDILTILLIVTSL